MTEMEEISSFLESQLNMQVPRAVSKEEILERLEVKISELVHRGDESLFQLMYKLDIAEAKVGEALRDPANCVAKIALLIYERQEEKVRSRNNTKADGADDPELKW